VSLPFCKKKKKMGDLFDSMDYSGKFEPFGGVFYMVGIARLRRVF
jgi:hypothetical protein